MAKKYGEGEFFAVDAPTFTKCHHSHPVIKLGTGEIVGGNCHQPRPGFDIYVGLDYEMAPDENGFPWSEKRVELVHYPITDMAPPHESKVFIKMIDWLCNQLQDGKRIHVGCIGGHGRTGIVLSAIAAKFGHKDAIQWVRKHHCEKAVESDRQVQFLMKHFGCSSAPGAKMGGGKKHEPAKFVSSGFGQPLTKESFKPSVVGQMDVRSKSMFAPAASKKSIWN